MTEWRNIHHLHQLLYLALHILVTQVLFGVVRGVSKSRVICGEESVQSVKRLNAFNGLNVWCTPLENSKTFWEYDARRVATKLRDER